MIWLFAVMGVIGFNVQTETSSLYKNYILSSFFSSNLSFQINQIYLIPDFTWTGKKNTVSHTVENTHQFLCKASWYNWNVQGFMMREKIDQHSGFTEIYDGYITLGRQYSLNSWDFQTEIGPAWSYYTSQDDTSFEINNSGILLNAGLFKLSGNYNLDFDYKMDWRNETQSHHTNLTLNLDYYGLEGSISGIFNDEKYPLTGGSSHYQKREIYSELKYFLPGWLNTRTNLYMDFRWREKVYPEKAAYNFTDIFGDGGISLQTDFQIGGTELVYNFIFSQGYGTSIKESTKNEDFYTAEILLSCLGKRRNFQIQFDIYQSIYRFYKQKEYYQSDFDVADCGWNLLFSTISSSLWSVQAGLNYRENNTVYISGQYSINNSTHKSYGVFTQASYYLWKSIKLDQKASLKADYTYVQYDQQRNILNRCYDNYSLMEIPITTTISCYLEGKWSLEDRGGYRQSENPDDDRWYFYRNKFIENWLVNVQISWSSNSRTVTPFMGIEEKVTYFANGQQIGNILDYQQIKSMGVEILVEQPPGNFSLNVKRELYNEGKELWEVRLSLFYWF